MKTAKEFIKDIKPNAGNLSHISATGQINGTLLIDTEKAMKEYAKQWTQEAVSAMVRLNDGEPPANALFHIFNQIDKEGC